MVTHPSYQIFPHLPSFSFLLSLSPSLSLSLSVTSSFSRTVSLSRLSPPLNALSLHVSLSLYISVFPSTGELLSRSGPFAAATCSLWPSPSLVLPLALPASRSRALACRSPSLALALLPPRAASLLPRKKTIHCQYSRPRLPTMKPTFFTGVNSHYRHIYLSFLLFSNRR